MISSTGITPDDFGNTNISTTMLKAAESEIKELHIQKLTTQVFGFLAAGSISLLTDCLLFKCQIK